MLNMCHIYFGTVLLFLLTITGNESTYTPEQNCNELLQNIYNKMPSLAGRVDQASKTTLDTHWKHAWNLLKERLCKHSVEYKQTLNITHYDNLPYTVTKLGYLELLNILKNNELEMGKKFDSVHYIIHVAALNDRTDALYYLITHGVNMNVLTPEWSYYPIHSAALSGSLGCVRLLVALGAWCTVFTYERNTPLHLAAEKGYVDIVKELLKYKRCNKTIKNKYGKTAYDVATERNYKLIAELLSSN